MGGTIVTEASGGGGGGCWGVGGGGWGVYQGEQGEVEHGLAVGPVPYRAQPKDARCN